ncbi:hypothetical protein [Thermocatellispora tengchongensis]|uniref:hypothetical protein n=1 Tax=Thermocatellispora tengchongensis TaxID=1073253 RepID=UPI0031EA542F
MSRLIDAASASARVSPGRELGEVAAALVLELGRSGLRVDVHPGDRSVVVSVWRDLLVRCVSGPDGALHYVWWTGRTSRRTGRPVLTSCSADHPGAAAARVLARYRELRAGEAGLPALPALGAALPV